MVFSNKNEEGEKKLKVFQDEQEAVVLEFQDREVELVNKLRPDEFFLMRRVIDYAIPFLMGWHVLQSRSFAEEDIERQFDGY